MTVTGTQEDPKVKMGRGKRMAIPKRPGIKTRTKKINYNVVYAGIGMGSLKNAFPFLCAHGPVPAR